MYSLIAIFFYIIEKIARCKLKSGSFLLEDFVFSLFFAYLCSNNCLLVYIIENHGST